MGKSARNATTHWVHSTKCCYHLQLIIFTPNGQQVFKDDRCSSFVNITGYQKQIGLPTIQPAYIFHLLILIIEYLLLLCSLGNVPRDCPKDYNVEASNDNFTSDVTILKEVRDAPDCAPDVIVTVTFENRLPFNSYR